MKGFALYVAGIRFIEIFVSSVVISLLLTAMCVFGIIPETRQDLTLSLFFCTAIYLVINVTFLHKCYLRLNDIALYYFCNYAAYFAFAVISLAIYFIFGNTIYSWLFSITKFARFATADTGVLGSAVFFHVMMVVTIAIAPLGMNSLMYDYIPEEPEDEEEYK